MACSASFAESLIRHSWKQRSNVCRAQGIKQRATKGKHDKCEDCCEVGEHDLATPCVMLQAGLTQRT
eukprot:4936047-Amphidinium_carterae.1